MHCTLVGSGPLYEDLSARTEALNIADIVTMVGPMPQPDIIRLMKNSNMVVAPCVISDDSDRDGLPTVLLESAALGTPVISTQVTGIPELVIDGETGFCVPPENPQVLIETMAHLLDDHGICRAFSRSGRALVKREYDEDRNAAKLRQVLNDAIDSRPAVQTEGGPMRVAYICADPGILIFGIKGASVRVQEVVKVMLSRGLNVTLFAQWLGGDVPEALKNVPIRKLETLPKDSVEIRARAALTANAKAEAMLEAEGPSDMIYERYSLWSSADMDFAKRHGCAGILEVNAPLVEEQKKHRELPLEGEAQRTAEPVFTAADAMIVVPSGVKQYLETFEKARGRVHVVTNGVALDHFAPAAEKNARRLQAPTPSSGVTVGFLGTLKPWHGLATLVEAWALLRQRGQDVYLLIVGDGPEHESLHNRIDALGLLEHVELTGAVQPKNVPKWLGRMDVAVAPYPNMKHFYSSPLKIYEYMTAGIPVVTAKVGHLESVVEHNRNGMPVEAGDPRKMTDCIASFIKQPAELRRLGTSTHQTAEQGHSWLAAVGRILRVAADTGRLKKTVQAV